MSESTLGTKLVRVRFQHGKTGLIYATSPDITGLVVGRPTMAELMVAIPQAIREMYASCNERIIVTRVEANDDSDENSWVAMPERVARAGLAEALVN